MEKEIIYLKGDATNPNVGGNKIIAHICNDIGAWGKGFVLAVSRSWSEPENQYKAWYKVGDDFKLGKVQFVQVSDEIYVANMIGQRGIRRGKTGTPPIRYEAVDQCLEEVAKKAIELDASIHMPRIGCGLAGGKWEEIEKLINKNIISKNIDVYVYDIV
ncbi:macro domain-containing protein [Clostridium manihotivorum]|uniref:Appr-1-p processing protein n=1 Tax=Clostridium manihotivorum TaxID=2320868 RepID=A0A410DTK0_9CLOT|nr:macro domain-containing protein [Clostridium manihotivorum]QAA32377.1 Appr-1-p processing protein [Clostridium manihotivorum]